MNVKNNKRSKITRYALKTALINLLKTKHISEVTVTDICKEASINRSTFYSHFENQMDVLKEIENDIYEQFKLYLPGETVCDYKQTLSNNLEFIKNNEETFKVLLSDNGNQSFKNTIAKLSFGVNKEAADDTAFRYHRIFNINGFIGIIDHWLNTGMKESVDYMSDLILKLSNLEVMK